MWIIKNWFLYIDVFGDQFLKIINKTPSPPPPMTYKSLLYFGGIKGCMRWGKSRGRLWQSG
jgi:hypothetical protein